MVVAQQHADRSGARHAGECDRPRPPPPLLGADSRRTVVALRLRPRPGEAGAISGHGSHQRRMRGVVGVMLLVLAFGFTGTLAPAGARGDDDCVATDPTCFDQLPRDDTWERAIRLSAVPDWWEGDGVAVAAIDTGV